MRTSAALMAASMAALVSAMAFLSSSALAAAASATLPSTLPAGGTDNDLFRELIEFRQRFMVEDYEKRGHRDPRWDALATKLIKAENDAYIAERPIARYYAPPRDWPTPLPLPERIRMAHALLDSPCDDPIALYIAGEVLEAGHIAGIAANAYRRADEACDRSGCVSVLKLSILERAIATRDKTANDNAANLAKMKARLGQRLAAALSDRVALPKYRALFCEFSVMLLQPTVYENADLTPDEMPDVREPDPWLYELYLGQIEINKAWKARGRGFASTVTDAGGKGFAQHLQLAREHLERANNIDTSLPHPAALLITIAMGQSDSKAALRWYEEAVSRQVDFYVANDRYLWVIQPRWMGSRAEQMKFAKRLVATNRFDTRVPATALYVLKDIEDDQNHPFDRDESENLLPLIMKITEGYAAASQDDVVRMWANSTRAAWLAKVGQWQAAREVLDRTPTLDPSSIGARGFEWPEFVGEVLARSSTRAAQISAALEEEDASRRVKLLEAICAEIQNEPAAASVIPERATAAADWLKRRRDEAAFLESLASGEWVPIPIPPDLKGWRLESGTWKAEADNAILGTLKSGLMAMAPLQMPERFELRCTVEPVGEFIPEMRGIYLFPAWSPVRKCGAWISLSGGQSYLLNGRFREDDLPVERAGNAVTIRFRYDRGSLTAIDEAGRRLAGFREEPEPIRRLALGGITDGANITFRFSDIAVRELK